MKSLVSNPTSTHPAIAELRTRLDQFYATTTNYQAFQGTIDRDGQYRLLDTMIRDAAEKSGRARVLELGAGRSGYPDYLARHHASRFVYDAQDVICANEEYLRPRSRHFFVDDIANIKGEYDLVLSTFVLEHVSNPSEFLAHVKRLLARNGWHVIFCPRYDAPGYVCPSLRHLSRVRRWMHAAWLAGSRMRARLQRRPRFWVNTDPSLFYGPWYCDADAVHLVSRFDVEEWHRQNGFRTERLSMPYSGIKQMIYQRWLTLNVACQKQVHA